MTSLLIGKGIVQSQTDDTTASTLKETHRWLPLDAPRRPHFRLPPYWLLPLLSKVDPVLTLDFTSSLGTSPSSLGVSSFFKS